MIVDAKPRATRSARLAKVSTAFCLTLVVFFLTNLGPNLEKIAKSEAGGRISDAEVESWLARNGYGDPMLHRYCQWLGVVPQQELPSHALSPLELFGTVGKASSCV